MTTTTQAAQATRAGGTKAIHRAIEKAAERLHVAMKVDEAQARCWLTHSKRGTRIVVQRLSDGVSSSVFVPAVSR